MEELQQSKSHEQELYEIVRSNAVVTEEILVISRSIKKYIFWLQVMSVLKLVVVIVPLVIGLWFFSSSYFDQLSSGLDLYGELLGVQQTDSGSGAEQSPADVFEQIEQLKASGQLDNLLQ